jgi:hypothetical protein
VGAGLRVQCRVQTQMGSGSVQGSVQAYSIQGGFGFSAELRLRWFGFRVGSGKWVQVHYRVQVSYSGVQVGFV